MAQNLDRKFCGHHHQQQQRPPSSSPKICNFASLRRFLLLLWILLVVDGGWWSAVFAQNFEEVGDTEIQRIEQQRQRLETLQLVQVFYRHGERNPLESLGPRYPNDVNNFTRGWGQLTKKGEEQTYQFGKYLRQRYDGFIHSEYKPDDIFVVSSPLDRTIMSGLSTLRGLYPKVSSENATDSYHVDEPSKSHVNEASSSSAGESQLVPIRTLDAATDNILHYTMPCPKYDQIYDSFWPKHPKILQIEASGKHLLKEFNNGTGRNATSLGDTGYVIDYIKVLTHQNRPLEHWMSREMVQTLYAFMSQRVVIYLGTPELRRFRSPVVQKVIKAMRAMASKKSKETNPHQSPASKTRKMLLYSAHDLTLVTILNVLGFELDNFPPYTSAIMIELHKNSTLPDYHVEIYFRNITNGLNWAEPTKLEVPHCPSPCFLGRLEEILSPLFIQNYEKECQLITSSLNGSSAVKVSASFLPVIVFFSTFLAILFSVSNYY